MLNLKIEDYINYSKNIEKFGINDDDNKILQLYNFREKVERLNDTTLNSYKNGYDFDKGDAITTNYNDFYNLKDIKYADPLHTYGCVKNDFKNNNIVEDITTFISPLLDTVLVNSYAYYTSDYNSILEKISNDLDKVKLQTNETVLKGPIYALIYQSPYLRINDGIVISKYDTVNNYKSSYTQDNNNVTIGTKELFTMIYVIYPNYYNESDVKISSYPNEAGRYFFKNFFNKDIMSRDKLCFMECNTINNTACGCANLEKNSNIEKSYDNLCVDFNNNKKNYGMLYSLNSFNKLFYNKFTTNDY